MSRAFLFSALLFLAATAGCNIQPATQTLVFVHADPALYPAASILRISIFTDEGEQVLEDKPVDRADEILANLFLVPRGGDALRTWEIVAHLMDGETQVAELRVGGGYGAGETRTMHVHFDTDPGCPETCGEGRTCHGGRCVGACFESTLDDSTVRADPICGECGTCRGAECIAVANGNACGCGLGGAVDSAPDSCLDGRCQIGRPTDSLGLGEHHACANLNGTLWCWGDNHAYRNGLRQDTDVPVSVGDQPFFSGRQYAFGSDFSCALWTNSGPVEMRTCWGWNGDGVYGFDPGTSTEIFHDEPPGAASIHQMAAGRFHLCILRHNGSVACYGKNNRGQIGAATSESGGFEVGNGYDSLSVGWLTSCARSAGVFYCWGQHNPGRGPSEAHLPSCIADGAGECIDWLVSMVIGAGAECGLDAEGRAFCWGSNEGGRLGIDGPSAYFGTPTAVDTDLRFSSLQVGQGGICGITIDDDALYCWGDNANGELGVGDRAPRVRPTRVEVDPGDRWLQVVLRSGYTCGLRSDGDVYCWGANGSVSVGGVVGGRLGLGLGVEGEVGNDAIVVSPRRVCMRE